MSLLGISIKTLEAVSSISLTAMSTIVATVALMFNYRENIGWKPIILVTSLSIHPSAIEVKLEFWNRRKYPVLAREAQVRIKGAFVETNFPGLDDLTNIAYRDFIASGIGERVQPGEHLEVTLKAKLQPNQVVDESEVQLSIRLSFFDPYLNRLKLVAIGKRVDPPMKPYVESTSPKSSWWSRMR